METAKEIAKLKSMNVEVIDALQELHFGDWEGKTFEEIEHCWPGMIEEMYHHPNYCSCLTASFLPIYRGGRYRRLKRSLTAGIIRLM